MNMHDFVQGSDAWHQHRASARNASDAPAMMGVSPYKTRTQLLREKATGITPDIDAATQARFDRGHAVEPLLREVAEGIIGEDLFPVVAVSADGYLSASFDGVSMCEDVIFEAKLYNAQKIEALRMGKLPDADYWQCVQQFAVCESAERLIYVCGFGAPENTAHLIVERAQIEADIPKLRAAWAQFDADVEAARAAPVEDVPPAEPVGRTPDTLPALFVEVRGQVVASNLDDWRTGALAIIDGINRNLQTDADFADAEKTVTWLKESEARLANAKTAALAQMTDVNALLTTVDDVAATMRATRLELDKLVKAEKESRKLEHVRAAADAVRETYQQINDSLPEWAQLGIPATLTADIGAAIKGLKTLASMRAKLDAAAAQAKVDASMLAARVTANVRAIEACGHDHLFNDRRTLVQTKAPDDLQNLIKARIAEFEAKEQARLEAERARIRAEEEARAQREAEAKAQAELARIRSEEQAKAQAEAAERARQVQAQAYAQTNAPKTADAPTAAATAAVGDARPAQPDANNICVAVAEYYGVGTATAWRWCVDAFAQVEAQA